MTLMSDNGRSCILPHDSSPLMLKVTYLLFSTLVSMLNPGKWPALGGNPDMIRSLALNASQQEELYTSCLVEVVVFPVRASAGRVGVGCWARSGYARTGYARTGWVLGSRGRENTLESSQKHSCKATMLGVGVGYS